MKNLSPLWLFQFELLMKTGNFTETAVKLNLPQQALSRNIQLLETWAGQPLLKRLQGRLEPTPGGSALLAETPELLRTLQQAYLSTRTQPDLVHLGIAALWNRHFLPAVLTSLFDSHPELQLQISPLDEADILAFLLAGELDVGLMLTPPWQGLQAYALPPIPWVLAGVPELSETALPYFNLTAAGASPDPGLMPATARCTGEVNSQEALRDLLLTGLGAGFILWPYVRADVEQGRLRLYDSELPPAVRPHLVWLENTPVTEWLDVLSTGLEQEMRA